MTTNFNQPVIQGYFLSGKSVLQEEKERNFRSSVQKVSFLHKISRLPSLCLRAPSSYGFSKNWNKKF